MSIHQACSGLSRREITEVSRRERFAFECSSCNHLIAEATAQDETPCPPGVELEANTPVIPEKRRKTRGKRRATDDLKTARRERRKKKRKKKKKDREEPKMKGWRIVTWNLQSISARDQNRNRLRRAVEHERRKKWNVVMFSEIRSEQEGVIWFGEQSDLAAVIHSQNCGILQPGDALEDWINCGQQKNFSEHVTAIVEKLRLISTYQILRTNGPEGIDRFRKDLENQLARIPKDTTSILGGD